MQKGFLDILNIARENVQKNPDIAGVDTHEVIQRYVSGLKDEIEEVQAEVKLNNEVYLVDELSDIAWDYATLIAILEDRKLIQDAEDVLAHGYEKYAERAPALAEKTQTLWDSIKAKQKEDLKKRHQEKYGA